MPPRGRTLSELLNNEALVVLGTLPGDAGNVWYNHKDRFSINKKFWLNDQNDVFFFSTKVDSGWNMVHALLVKESALPNKVWIEGRDVKFLKREFTFQYSSPQDEPDGGSSSAGQFAAPDKLATACRICRLPWDFGRDRKEKLVPIVVYVSAETPDHVFALNGHISAIEGTGKDVKAVLQKCHREGASSMALLRGNAFWLTYDYRHRNTPRADMIPAAGSNTEESDEPSMTDALAANSPIQATRLALTKPEEAGILGFRS